MAPAPQFVMIIVSRVSLSTGMSVLLSVAGFPTGWAAMSGFLPSGSGNGSYFAREGEYPWEGPFRSSLCNTKEGGLATVTPVDMYPEGASRFGVMDLSGNVWERCLGLFDNPAKVAVSEVSNRTIRGGSWRYSRAEAKTRYRQLCIADRRFDDGVSGSYGT